MIRLFFRLVRAVLGPILLVGERLFQPTPLSRAPAAQALVDERTRGLALYQFATCPFCIKVRREIRRLGLRIELRDARGDEGFARELLEQGGQRQVPCLRIPEGEGRARWLYESDDIIAWLRERFDVGKPGAVA